MFCRVLLIGWLSLAATPAFAQTGQQRAVYETEVDAPVEEVWKAFTTGDGLKAWMAPIVDIHLTVGGKMRANYQKDGSLDDDNTIENTILSYDPPRMLSLKATKYPKNFPFVEAAKKTWSVFYFSKLSPTRTKVTVVGLGYTEDEQSQKMRAFFAGSNRYVLDKMKKALKEKALNKKE